MLNDSNLEQFVVNAHREYIDQKNRIQKNENMHEIMNLFSDVEIFKFQNVHYLFVGMLDDSPTNQIAVVCTLESSGIFQKPGLHTINLADGNKIQKTDETMPYMNAVAIVRTSVNRFKIKGLLQEEICKVAKKSDLYLSCLL